VHDILSSHSVYLFTDDDGCHPQYVIEFTTSLPPPLIATIIMSYYGTPRIRHRWRIDYQDHDHGCDIYEDEDDLRRHLWENVCPDKNLFTKEYFKNVKIHGNDEEKTTYLPLVS
jgi:hypothetical protein